MAFRPPVAREGRWRRLPEFFPAVEDRMSACMVPQRCPSAQMTIPEIRSASEPKFVRPWGFFPCWVAVECQTACRLSGERRSATVHFGTPWLVECNEPVSMSGIRICPYGRSQFGARQSLTWPRGLFVPTGGMRLSVSGAPGRSASSRGWHRAPAARCRTQLGLPPDQAWPAP